MFFMSDDTRADSGNNDHLTLQNELPPFLWGEKKPSTDSGKIHSASLIKIQIYLSKPSHNPSISYKKTWKA